MPGPDGPPHRGPDPGAGWLPEARAQGRAVDQAVFDAVADTPTPNLDRFLVGLSHAADNSRLWLVTASILAAVGGPRGRRAAGVGVAAIALASAVANLGLKPLTSRARPVRSRRHEVAPSRRVRRTVTTSFPSGHTASAFAFASAVGEVAPRAWAPLHLTAALVGYSRVHTGVHYPSDVAAGALLGTLCGWTTRRAADRLRGGASVLGRRPGTAG